MSNIAEPGETAGGAVNGVNKVFSTLKPYVSGKLGVLRNGIEVDPATITELTSTTYQLATAPYPGDRIQNFYVEDTP